MGREGGRERGRLQFCIKTVNIAINKNKFTQIRKLWGGDGIVSGSIPDEFWNRESEKSWHAKTGRRFIEFYKHALHYYLQYMNIHMF